MSVDHDPDGRSEQDVRHGVAGAIAHAATPWEWKSRAAVVALVVVSVTLPIAWIVSIWLDDDVASPFLTSLIWGVLALWLAVRPAVRSLRRWNDNHPTTAEVA